ncbi:MAG: hypothetical protein R3C10_00920 [Pirellulales bacterium]
MDKLLLDFDLNATTWVYVSSLIAIAVYFKFSRFWSVRNLDLVGLVAMGPGLLLCQRWRERGLCRLPLALRRLRVLLLRMLMDPMMAPSPLEPNLSVGGSFL